MKPFQYIIKHCKTQKQVLEVCESLINYFVGTQEAEWAVEVTLKQNNRSTGKSRASGRSVE